MMDVSNRVYSNVRNYVTRLFPETNFQNSRTATPQRFPSVSVIQIDGREVAIDLDPGSIEEDFSIDSNVEIQCYSSIDIAEAKKIINASCDAMRGMAYARTYGPSEIPNQTSPNLYRMVARFRRIVSSLGELPQFEFPDEEVTGNGEG